MDRGKIRAGWREKLQFAVVAKLADARCIALPQRCITLRQRILNIPWRALGHIHNTMAWSKTNES